MHRGLTIYELHEIGKGVVHYFQKYDTESSGLETLFLCSQCDSPNQQ